MTISVLYFSETGNTELIAREIHSACSKYKASINNMTSIRILPKADLYFVGFPIHERTCNLTVINTLNAIENSNIALFATCGLEAGPVYKYSIENSIWPWIDETNKYHGMYICRGKASDQYKQYFRSVNPLYSDELSEMFNNSFQHPDRYDIEGARIFTENILKKF